MWYHATNRRALDRDNGVSRLANFLRERMAARGWNQGQLAAKAEIRESTLSNILNKEGVIPRPDTVKALAKALEIDPPFLTALLDYPIDSSSNPNSRYVRLARELEASPWLAERIDDLLHLSPEEFRELMDYLDFRRRRRRGGDQSNP